MTATATRKAKTDRTGLEPLDFSEYIEPPSDNPELDTFKQKVIEEARKHSRNHHCGEYKSVLRNLGISDKAVAEVKVTFQTVVGFNFDVKVKPEELAGKTATDQAEYLAKKVGQVKVSGSGGSGALTITPESIVSWTLPVKKAAPAAGSDTAPEGFTWIYISNEARVRHLVPVNVLSRLDSGDWYTSSTRYTKCSLPIYTSYMPRDGTTPPKATGGNCTKCQRSAGSLNSSS